LVFTIPQCLHKTLYINQQEGYSLMFKAAWTALKDCLEKPAYYPQLQGLPAIEVLQMVTGTDPFVCPHCKKGRMQAISLWMKKHIDPG
jgi:hypothetical protein